MQQSPYCSDQLTSLAQGTARDLQSLQIKITYLGLQTKPTPTLVFNAYCHLLQMDWFSHLRQPNLHYNNDDIAVWHFTVMPDEMKQIVDSLRNLTNWRDSQANREPYISLMCVLKASRLGEMSCESVLDGESAKEVIRTIQRAIPSENRLAHGVLDLYWSALFHQ